MRLKNGLVGLIAGCLSLGLFPLNAKASDILGEYGFNVDTGSYVSLKGKGSFLKNDWQFMQDLNASNDKTLYNFFKKNFKKEGKIFDLDLNKLREFDFDNSGYVTFVEIFSGLEKLGYELPENLKSSSIKTLRDLMKDVEKNLKSSESQGGGGGGGSPSSGPKGGGAGPSSGGNQPGPSGGGGPGVYNQHNPLNQYFALNQSFQNSQYFNQFNQNFHPKNYGGKRKC